MRLPNEIRAPLATANAIANGATNSTATPAPSSATTVPAPVNQAPATNVVVRNEPAVIVATPTALPDNARAGFDAEESVYVNLYQRVNQSVVYIAVGTTAGQSGSGSGFVIDKQGRIVTNNHVVQGADKIDVLFSDGTTYSAKVLGRDSYADLAVIQVGAPAEKLVPVEFADSAKVLPGQKVIAMGFPFGIGGDGGQSTMTTGIVSAMGRTLPESGESETGSVFTNPDIIQTDAAINPGNSGGPLFDSRGRVIGINTAIRTNNVTAGTASNSGVGFAVPVNTIKRVIPVLISEGTYRYPYLGVTMRTIQANDVTQYSLPVAKGVIVVDLVQNGPAASAGLRAAVVTQNRRTTQAQTFSQVRDIITALNGQPVRDANELISVLAAGYKPGDTVNLTVYRDGQQITVPLKLGERPR
jgi:2-alkenal reductase